MSRIVSLIAAAIVTIALAACAATDGGIEGTGNRVDCDKAREPLPPECKR